MEIETPYNLFIIFFICYEFFINWNWISRMLGATFICNVAVCLFAKKIGIWFCVLVSELIVMLIKWNWMSLWILSYIMQITHLYGMPTFMAMSDIV